MPGPRLAPALPEWSADYEHLHEPIVVGSPPAGTGFTHTVPGAVVQRIVSVCFTYTAAGGGGVRTPRVRFVDSGGRQFAVVSAPFTVASGSTSVVTFAIDLVQFGANNAAAMGAALPPFELTDGMGLVASALAIGAADTLTVCSLFVDQWSVRPRVGA